jgi:D-xylose transport system substrate-binding protein
MKFARSITGMAGIAVIAVAMSGCASGGGGAAPGGDEKPPSGTSDIELTADSLSDAGSPDEVFAQLEQLKDVAAAGEGKIAVLLPDTQSSSRYVEQDTPAFERAFATMGLSEDDYIILNAQASPTTQQTQAEQAIANGASVLLLDNLDSGSGAAIQANAAEAGVATIDYDRLTLNGSASYYVSFDNQYVGTALAEGLVKCIDDWDVEDPNVYVLAGSPTDNNATLSQIGIDDVIDPMASSGDFTIVEKTRVRDWDNQVGQTMFEQALTANPEINAVLSGNDGLANAAISVLKNQGVEPFTVPTTGQDATLQGMQNILAGYQCMSVYKKVYIEAAAAAALAVMVRAGVEPPSGLINGEYDAESHMVPSLLLRPVSVDASNMQETVVADNVIDPADLCTGEFAALCEENGIK